MPHLSNWTPLGTQWGPLESNWGCWVFCPPNPIPLGLAHSSPPQPHHPNVGHWSPINPRLDSNATLGPWDPTRLSLWTPLEKSQWTPLESTGDSIESIVTHSIFHYTYIIYRSMKKNEIKKWHRGGLNWQPAGSHSQAC